MADPSATVLTHLTNLLSFRSSLRILIIAGSVICCWVFIEPNLRLFNLPRQLSLILVILIGLSFGALLSIIIFSTLHLLVKPTSLIKSKLCFRSPSPITKQAMQKMKNVILIFSAYALTTTILTFLTDNYNKTFWSSFLVNANSSILDFLILGVVLYYFEYQRQNKEAINEILEDLGNLAKHSAIDLKIQKIKIIRQLNNKGVYKIDVPRIDLADLITIKYLSFEKSVLSGLDMSNSNIRDCNFTECTIQALNISHTKIPNVKFRRCKIKNIKAMHSKIEGVIFEDCYLEGGDFSNAEMKSCVLKFSDLKKVKYDNAVMRNANIISAKNVNLQDLIKAKDLDYLNCDIDVAEKLVKIKPNIKLSEKKIEARESNH